MIELFCVAGICRVDWMPLEVTASALRWFAGIASASAPEPEKKGNLTAALRASRHEAQKLRKENELLRAGKPAVTEPVIPPIDDATRADLTQYAPKAADRLAAVEAENERLRNLVRDTTPPPVVEFEPEVLPARISLVCRLC